MTAIYSDLEKQFESAKARIEELETALNDLLEFIGEYSGVIQDYKFELPEDENAPSLKAALAKARKAL